MSSYTGEEFRKFKDNSAYFITEDALAPLDHDITFSPTNKYYCGANCQVCYIKQKLNQHLPYYSNAVPTKITAEEEKRWYEIFSYFYVIRVVDDLSYLKENYPYVYSWYKEHASTFEYGMTDNALIKQHKTLMELDMKGLSEVALSEEFMNKVNSKKNYNKIIEILQDYISKYDLHKVKVIKTTETELPYHAKELVEWINDKGIVTSLHNDYRKRSVEDNELGNADHDLQGLFDYQNSHVLCYNDRTYQVYRGSLHLYGDRFFYSIDDATDINWDPFHIMSGDFDHREFMYDMVNGKFKLYNSFSEELKQSLDSTAQKFRDYYINTVDTFVVNREFNFIPKMMLSENSKYYHKLIELGYRRTEVGLYFPSGDPTPIISFK
jgi:hypothetical protein